MRAKLGCRDQTPAEEPQRKVCQLAAAIRRRKQYDTTELSRPSHRKRPPHDDGSHAVADEMEPLDGGVLVEPLCLGCKPRRMRLDRSPHAPIAPVHGVKSLSR